MARPTRRAAKLAAWIAVPAAVLISGAAVAGGSYSAFSATTSNPTNNWTAGTVALTDDDANTAMFTATNLKPGSTGTKCILVTSTGSLASLVKLYGTSSATTNALSTYIDLTVTQGSGATSSSCTGFTPLATGSSVYSGTLANFASSYTSYSNGISSWTTTGAASETRAYQFTYSVQAAAPNSAQGGTAALGFTWEAQNS
ncbi:hypothetical protein FJ657_02860 [Schumannella soli]|uniref:Camelysin metallo-endopeptidase n=1 Tax=Schumannella soli TaxID=2590779 RepID=A0A506XZ06_9MICO|nr:hypothetical protein FJ657_02860 [Schumannella soli]